MAELPGTPDSSATPPDVDALFPAKSVDELFPPDIERDRYRRQTLGTSPIQDLIFGNTEVNPVARVLDAFGQGVKNAWGASNTDRVSKETEDFLKINKQFDAWNEGQNGLVKAANESLFRPAAVQLTKEMHDAEGLYRGAGAILSGGQAAVAQIGEEAGFPKLGKEIAAFPEAFPTGHVGTGIPPAPWKYPLSSLDIPKAKELGVIGAGEDGYFGTAPSVPAETPAVPIATPKPVTGMPVDLFVEPRNMSAPEAAPSEVPAGEPAVASKAVEAEQPAPGIATDVAGKLVAAGRPEAEAQASGQVIASHYQARAERFNGERGTAEELYNAEGPEIRSAGGKAPVKSEPIKPTEGDAAAVEGEPKPTLDGGAAATTEEAPVTGFTTAKGSTYQVHEDGTTTRDKAARSDVGHEGDSGIKAQTARTIYVDGDASVLSGAGLTGNVGGKGYRVAIKDNKATFLWWNEKAGKWGAPESGRDIPFTTEPAVGKSPVELWKPTNDVPGHEAYRGQHAGNKITEVRRASPEPITTVPELKTALRGRAAADPQTWSLYEFLAKEGGLKPTADLKSILGGKNPFIPGFGPLLRESGLSMDEALTRAKEGAYVLDPNDIQHVPGAANTGELTKSVNDLHDMIDAESRGKKNYRVGQQPKEKPVDAEQRAHDILAELHHEVEAVGGKVDPALENRVVEIMTKEGETDVHSAYERAIMEDHDNHEALLNERRSAHGPIEGHDNDGGSASRAGEELARESRTAEPSAKDAREADGGQSRDHGEADRSAGESLNEANARAAQLTRGQPSRPSRIGLGEGVRLGKYQDWTPGRVVKVGFVDGLKVEGIVPAEFHGDAPGFILTKGENVYRVTPHRGMEKLSPTDGRALLERAKANELELNQIKRGKINLRADAKPIITLFKDANASTFIHETGHQWLEELMADAEHPKAPADLKKDAITVLDWLGVKDADAIKTSHHEKFARGFERYMMEGKAPNQALASVFAKFKDWLTRIYQTVTRLKSPITDEIRGVFDRLLTLHPEDVKIEPETPAKSFADIHEADAANTPPEMAHPAAETIQAERDSVAARHLPEDNNARLEDVRAKAERLSARDSKSDSNADAARSDAGEAGSAEAPGAVGASGVEVAPEGAPTPKISRTEPPVGPHDKFPDKAGNIRLDNLNTPEELNQIIRQTAEDNGDFQNVRGPVSDAQVLDLAEAAGVDAAFIDSRKLGEAWTAPQIVALRRLLIQSAQSVHDLAAKAATGAEADVMAYAQAKARHQLIQERVSSVTAEAGRALRAFQSKFTDGVAGDVSAFLKDATGKTLFQLQQEAKFLSKLQTPQQTSKFINDTSKGTFRNAILEYYINALISGPVTHSRYIVSNAINAIFTPIVEIPFAAAVGKAREIVKGEPIERVHLSEAKAQLFALTKGSREGLNAAIEAFKSGVSPALPSEKISPHFAEASHAIPGTVGKVLRLPSRSVAGIHSFFKAVRYEQNIHGLAYRLAENEGLNGDAFTNRVADLITNPTEAMMTEATNNALKELYMSPTEYHSKMGGLVRFTNQNLAAKIVVPFMKIGSQITRNAFMERTPLGLLDRKVRSSLSGERGGGELDLQAGKITAGVALMATSVGLMAEGMMTGDGPEDPAKRAVWLLSHTPASIQIGDINFKYGNTGPLGMLMRFVANTYETAEHMGEKDLSTLAVSFFEGLGKSVLDETFLRGVKDALDAMFHPKEYGGRYIKSQITNWMPWSVGMSQVARKIDPFQRETKGIWQAAQAKIPYLSEGLMPRRDMFGEPIPNAGPLPDYASDPVVKAMDDLHIGVGKIGKKIRGIDLTEQQYDDLSRVAGRMAKMQLNAMVNLISNPNIPPAKRIEMIHNAISSSRNTARDLVMMQNPEIVNAARRAKEAQLRPDTVH